MSAGQWKTRFGFYLAAIGSAVGLGNLWRFPFVTSESGGGAFVLLYIVGVLLVGIPVLVGELMLGKMSRQGIWLSEKKWVEKNRLASQRFLPSLSVIVLGACFLVVCYYAVVSGWVLHFLMQAVGGAVSGELQPVDDGLRWLKQNGLFQFALVGVHLTICLFIVSRGVQEGIEKWVGSVMPLFFVLLITLVYKSLEVGEVEDAFRYLFYPDFSKLTLYSPLYAIGHVFFTLSVGLGTMVTFGSYLKKESNVPNAAFRVAALDTLISLIAGILVFPTLVGMSMAGSGPELLFRAVPRLLSGIEYGWLFGISFFLCLYIAALGASIGLLETLVSNLSDRFKISRWLASWCVGLGLMIGASLPAFSSSFFGDVTVFGRSIFIFWDAVVVNGLMPLGVLFMCWLLFSRVSAADAIREFVNDDSLITQSLYPYWRWTTKWLVPTVILFSFVCAAFALATDLGLLQVAD